MTGDRSARMDTIVQSAMVRPPEARDAFVKDACEDDAALRDEVLSLLAHAESAGGFLEPEPGRQRQPLEPGQQLGRYTLEGLIGAGGMGEVYRARDPRLGRDIAIKVLPLEVAQDPERLRRFEQEARAVAALNHPNIVTIFSVEQDRLRPARGASEETDLHFITMELVDGKALRDLIPPHGLALDRLLDVAVPLADAVGAAHARGIIHRDLKPANVMVTRDGLVKVLDFGLAKLRPLTSASDLTTRSTPDLTADGRLLGTAAYMSPEQAEGGEVDHRSDLFSLGVLLFELATGQRPFKGDTGLSRLSSLLKDAPLSVAEVRPDLPREFGHIVRRCLAKDVRHRYQSAIDLRNELEELRQDLASGSLAPAGAVDSRRFRRLRLFAWIAGSLAAAAAIMLPYLAWRGRINLGSLSSPPAVQPVATRVQFSIPVPESVKYIGNLSVSPDGSRVSFVGAGQLWIHELATGKTRPVKGIVGPEPQFPFWSPDGQFIAYFQVPVGKLRKVPVAGGIPQDIADAPGARGGSWGADNTIVFAALARQEGLEQRTAIYRVSAGGGVAVQITRPDPRRGEVDHRWPHVLSDGRHFTYLAWGTPSIVYVASPDPNEPRSALTTVRSEAYVASGYVLTVDEKTLRAQAFASNGLETAGESVSLASDVIRSERIGGHHAFGASAAVLAYSVVEPRRYQFSVVDRTGQHAVAVGPPILLRDDMLGGWSLSPDGRKLAFTQLDTETQRGRIWEMDLEGGAPVPFSPGVGSDSSPLWSPSGDQVVYSSALRPDGAGGNLYLKRSGSDIEMPIGEPSLDLKVPYDWHPDGQRLLFGMQGPTRQYNMWILSKGQSGKPVLWYRSDSRETYGQFSPDGRWVAYMSDESGADDVYVRRFPSADGKQRISPAGGEAPGWRRDGKALFYFQDDTLMEVDLDAGTMARVGMPRPLFKLADQVGCAALPDGNRFVLHSPVDAVPPPRITVILNWTDGLKRK